MMTDNIADMLTRIRNAVALDRDTVEMPASQQKQAIADVLRKEGFIEDYRVVGELPHRLLKIYLKYGPYGEKVIQEIARVSRPGRRIYKTVKNLPYVRNGAGILIVSTSNGVISDRQCRKQDIGGEIICSVY